MSFYQSADLTEARQRPHFEDQSSAVPFNARSKKQQIDGVVLCSQVLDRPQHRFDGGARVYDRWQHQNDHGTSNNLASRLWRQQELDRNTDGEFHPSDAQFRDTHQSPFADLNTNSQLTDRLQLGQHDTQYCSAQHDSGSPAPENAPAEPAPVRLPTFIYREPLPPYVPDESSPVEYCGKVVPPHLLGSYFLPRQNANPRPCTFPQPASQHALDQVAPLYPQVASIYREPLTPYVPDDMSPPVEHHGKVVSPENIAIACQPASIYREPLTSYVPDDMSPPVEHHGKVVSPENIAIACQPVVLVTHKAPPRPQSYLCWSIMCMIMCLPLGIAAVLCSSGVLIDNRAGRYEEAQRKSLIARWLNIVSTLLFFLAILMLAFTKSLLKII